MKISYLLVLAAMAAPSAAAAQRSEPHRQPELRGIWLHPGNAGREQQEVAASLEKFRQAGVITFILLVKNASALYSTSKLFPEAVDANYRDLDLLRAVITEAHERGMGADRAEMLRRAQTTLAQLPPSPRKEEFSRAVESLPQTIAFETDRNAVLALRAASQSLLSDPPPGFYPPERLLETIRGARANGAQGIVLFAADSIEREHLWDAVREGLHR